MKGSHWAGFAGNGSCRSKARQVTSATVALQKAGERLSLAASLPRTQHSSQFRCCQLQQLRCNRCHGVQHRCDWRARCSFPGRLRSQL